MSFFVSGGGVAGDLPLRGLFVLVKGLQKFTLCNKMGNLGYFGKLRRGFPALAGILDIGGIGGFGRE
jgi:hypothetical protein